jgi:Chromo (CHRromatin Organisation MOdifier) domain
MKTRAKAAVASIEHYNQVMARDANNSRRDAEFAVGYQVLLSTRFFKPPPDAERGRKLAPKFAGPYNVVAKVSPVAYKLQLPVGTNAHPVFHASLLKSYKADVTGTRIPAVSDPVQVDGQVEFIVESIIQDRRVRGRREFLVWKGYSSHDATWEPLDNVVGSHALIDFEESRVGRSIVNPTLNSLERDS